MVAQPTVWPADCAGTLGQSASGTGSPGYSNQEIFSQNAANLIPQPVPIQDGREMQKAQNGLGIGTHGDPAYTLDTTGAQAVGQPVPFTKAKRAQSVTDDETRVDGQVNPTLSLFDQGDTRATTVAVAFPINTLTLGGRPDAVNDKRMTMGVGENGDPQFTLQAAHGHAVAHAFYSTGGTHGVNQQPEVSPAVKVGSGLGIPSPPAVAFQQNQLGEVRCGNIAGTVNTNSNASGRNTPMAMQAMTVRRLTPRECERLQGFPDDYTLIPWRKKQAEDCPDGPRYKALGNSMAVNCMAWIGERIAALENNR
jgi:DNA (cytosine-5)-methyltransferase 1